MAQDPATECEYCGFSSRDNEDPELIPHDAEHCPVRDIETRVLDAQRRADIARAIAEQVRALYA